MECINPAPVPVDRNKNDLNSNLLLRVIPIEENNAEERNYLQLDPAKQLVRWSKMDNNFEPLKSSTTDDLITMEFQNLSYSVQIGCKKELKSILNYVSGMFEPGKLIGILGPSGAGKSTLLNVLSGFKTSNVSGSILINGEDRDVEYFQTQSCYIMQDESLLLFLSVEESMQVAAALKLGDKVSQEKKEIVINHTLEVMRLKSVKSTKVESLSGGERKRLSIALELVNNPPIMFFDEPTSGLDSLNSFQCVHMLKGLAERGRTIVCTIHQPSAKIFELFDHIYAMSEGQCIYNGSPDTIVPFLESHELECPSFHNPADFLIEVASGQYGSYISKLVESTNNPNYRIDTSKQVENNHLQNRLRKKENEQNLLSKEFKVEISIRDDLLRDECPKKLITYPASFYTQFNVLFMRTFKSIWRDSMLTLLRLLAHLVTGLLIGALYYKIGNDAAQIYSNFGFLFFNLLFLLFTAMMPTIVTFPLEMPVFLREYCNHWYSLRSYYLAKSMADFPFQIIFPIIYVVIVYFMTGQPMESGRFFLLTYFTIMTSLVAQSIGLTVGAAVNIKHAVFCGPVLSVPALLFSGFFVTYKTMPPFFQWLSYLSYLRYGYEGTILSIYGLNRQPLECTEAFCILKHPEKIFETLGINEDFLFYDGVILFLYFIVIRVIGYYVLKWKLSNQR